MKTSVHFFAPFLVLLLVVAPSGIANGTAAGLLHPVNAVRARYASAEDITQGAMDQSVLSRLGAPSHEPSRTVWIYHAMAAVNDETKGGDGCTNLVVTFKDRQVASLCLVNESVVQRILAEIKAHPNALPKVLVPGQSAPGP